MVRGSMDLTLKPGARMPKGRPYFQKEEGTTEQKKGKNKKAKKSKKMPPPKGPRRVSV